VDIKLIESLHMIIESDNIEIDEDVELRDGIFSLAESISMILEEEKKKKEIDTENQTNPPAEQFDNTDPQTDKNVDNTEEQPQSEPPIDNTEESPTNDQEQYDAGNETTDDGAGGDFQDGGIEGDGETSLEDVGKMYELKQIHQRLISVRNHLEIFVEEEFDEVKNTLSKAIGLFELVINNYDKYKEKIDDIIVMYYKFIQDVYELTKKKYKKYSSEKN